MRNATKFIKSVSTHIYNCIRKHPRHRRSDLYINNKCANMHELIQNEMICVRLRFSIRILSYVVLICFGYMIKIISDTVCNY